jgi:large subunit ribosomal protein L4
VEAVKYKMLNMEGKEVGEIDLDSEVFDAPAPEGLVHQVVRWQRARAQAGTHKAKNKREVSGGGKKPFRQKGTGRARQGSNTSPLLVGGGVSFGPVPRSHAFRLNKRVRRQGLMAVLSDKRREGRLIIIDNLAIESGKTKEMQAVLTNVGVGRASALLVLPEIGRKSSTARAGGNIARLNLSKIEGVNVYDLLKSRYLVGTRESVLALQARLQQEGKSA